MHKSAYDLGHKFLERYWNHKMESILEIGSFNVNGSLRDFQPARANWVGVDLEPGKGVDVVVEKAAKLPFEDKSFDLVIATSIFEHDPMFWLTFNEMLRVTKDGGFIFINAPSNGIVHRFPLDVYRFYPDAGVALVEWGLRQRNSLHLIESFIAEQDDDVWNDFVAVFGLGIDSHLNKIYADTSATNIWDEGKFLVESFSEQVEDRRKVISLKSSIINLESELSAAKQELEIMQKSKSWSITRPLRFSNSLLKSFLSGSAC